MAQPQTWHYGLVSEWWALFNVGGPEVDYYGRFVERGQPALDAGCGAGRLLVPWLKAGLRRMSSAQRCLSMTNTLACC